MTKEAQKSAAIKLLSIVYREAPRRSWRKTNSGLYDTINLAIETGLHFDLGDFQRWEGEYKLDHWGGQIGGGLGESIYSAACQVPNVSACQSFEAWQKRPPFILRGKRIGVGAKFFWGEVDSSLEPFTCTSFRRNEHDGVYIVACSYLGGGAPLSMEKITPEDLKRFQKNDSRVKSSSVWWE